MDKKVVEKWTKKGEILFTLTSKQGYHVIVLWGAHAGWYFTQKINGSKVRTTKQLIGSRYRKLGLVNGEPVHWPKLPSSLMMFELKTRSMKRVVLIRYLWNKAIDCLPVVVRKLMNVSKGHNPIYNALFKERMKVENSGYSIKELRYWKQYILDMHACIIKPTRPEHIDYLYSLCYDQSRLHYAVSMEQNFELMCRLGPYRFKVLHKLLMYAPERMTAEEMIERYKLDSRLDYRFFSINAYHTTIPTMCKDEIDTRYEHIAMTPREGLKSNYAICSKKLVQKSVILNSPTEFLLFALSEHACPACIEVNQDNTRVSLHEEGRHPKCSLTLLGLM